MYLYREYFKANVYTIWVHGPLGNPIDTYKALLFYIRWAPGNPWTLKP